MGDDGGRRLMPCYALGANFEKSHSLGPFPSSSMKTVSGPLLDMGIYTLIYGKLGRNSF
jgi:hypothetical protein